LDARGAISATERVRYIARVRELARLCAESWLAGREELTPPWDEDSLLEMAYEHLMHQPAVCPVDGTPVVFTSLPNPQRKARYRLSCFYCGRQAEMDWPPPESRR